jgi:hypothetical protein
VAIARSRRQQNTVEKPTLYPESPTATARLYVKRKEILMRYTSLSLALLLFGCERVESTDVRTSGIYADLDVVARGDGDSTVSASLRVGGPRSNTYLELVEGDALTAHQGEDETEMDEHSFPLGPVTYDARFEVDDENTPFRIEFAREAHDEVEENCRGGGAPNSFATLPAPFALDGPGADQTFSRADADIEITWSPNGFRDAMTWTVSGSCIHTESGDISGDPGRVSIERGRLRALDNRQAETCSMTVELVRTRAGAVDPAYGEGGSFSARQVRAISLRSAP